MPSTTASAAAPPRSRCAARSCSMRFKRLGLDVAARDEARRASSTSCSSTGADIEAVRVRRRPTREGGARRPCCGGCHARDGSQRSALRSLVGVEGAQRDCVDEAPPRHEELSGWSLPRVSSRFWVGVAVVLTNVGRHAASRRYPPGREPRRRRVRAVADVGRLRPKKVPLCQGQQREDAADQRCRRPWRLTQRMHEPAPASAAPAAANTASPGQYSSAGEPAS